MTYAIAFVLLLAIALAFIVWGVCKSAGNADAVRFDESCEEISELTEDDLAWERAVDDTIAKAGNDPVTPEQLKAAQLPLDYQPRPMSRERAKAIALAEESAEVDAAIAAWNAVRVNPPQQRVTYFHAGDMTRADLERTRR